MYLTKNVCLSTIFRCPLEVGLHTGVSIDILEMDEGKEATEFWRVMNIHIGERTQYHCLLDSEYCPFV